MNVRLSLFSLFFLCSYSVNYSLGGSSGSSRFLQTDHTITHQIELSEATQQIIKDIEQDISKSSADLRTALEESVSRLTKHPIKTTVEIEVTEKSFQKIMSTLSRIDSLLKNHLEKLDTITDKPFRHQIQIANPEDIKDILKTGSWYTASTSCFLAGLYLFSKGIIHTLPTDEPSHGSHKNKTLAAGISTTTIGALVAALGVYALLHTNSLLGTSSKAVTN